MGLEHEALVPIEERQLIHLKNELENAQMDNFDEDTTQVLSEAVYVIDMRLRRMRWPKVDQQSWETAAAVHNNRHFVARGLVPPTIERAETIAKEMLDVHWRPTPGNLEWCSCNACIHNCDVIERLGLKA